MKPWCQDWLRRWPGHCPPSFLLSLFPSKVRERLFSQTPWPLWAPLLRAWIKPFEKEIFYINGQPSNKLLQSSIPNHLVSHGELHPNVSSISSLIPLIILIIRSWHTRQVGRQAVGQAGRATERTDAHKKLFKCREADLPESEVSSLTHSLSLDAQEPTECCVYMSQHGHCLVDTTSDWSVQTDVCTVHSGTTFLSSIRSWMSKLCHHAAWNKQCQTSPLDRL